ncbi:hypothetical protein BYT27DRAFT_7186061, partial [Phlegmacium glaucopus]
MEDRGDVGLRTKNGPNLNDLKGNLLLPANVSCLAILNSPIYRRNTSRPTTSPHVYRFSRLEDRKPANLSFILLMAISHVPQRKHH